MAGADFYDVWVADLSTNQSQVLRNTHVIGTSWTPASQLSPGHQYQWWVRAVSNNGDASGWGTTSKFTVAYLAAPAPINPSGVVYPGFSWSAVTGADYYDLWVTDLTTGVSQLLRNTHIAATSFTPVTPLPAGHAFQWWVRALSNNGDYSSWSSASVPIKFTPYQPGAISGSIFNDLNGDGTRQTGEPGLQAWTVQLQSSTGAILQQTTTDSAGNYSFSGLALGTYTVVQVSPTGLDCSRRARPLTRSP